tara:strand:+ start:416 stop:709 length:294 start_codon:yes stop_codon:yes gene_type:complete
MKDQHTKIKGYRDLTQTEIDLMNEIKAHAEKTKLLLEKVKEMRIDDNAALNNKPEGEINGLTQDDLFESTRCLVLAKTNLQQGFMWLVRGVALPQSF